MSSWWCQFAIWCFSMAYYNYTVFIIYCIAYCYESCLPCSLAFRPLLQCPKLRIYLHCPVRSPVITKSLSPYPQQTILPGLGLKYLIACVSTQHNSPRPHHLWFHSGRHVWSPAAICSGEKILPHESKNSWPSHKPRSSWINSSSGVRIRISAKQNETESTKSEIESMA